MGEDLSTGMKIGITMIILVALISIVFSLLTLVKNITNPTVNKLQNQMDALSELSWNDYDQKIVTGADLKGFISLNMRDEVALLVSNGRMIKASDTTTGRGSNQYIQNYGVVLNCFKIPQYDDENRLFFIPRDYSSPIRIADTDVRPTEEDTNDHLVWNTKKNRYVASIPLAEISRTEAGDARSKISTNLNMGKMNDINSPEYIYLDHKYKTYLIEDPSGTILGIYFIEEDYCNKKGVA